MSLFDRAALGVMAAVGLLIGLLVWHGEQAGIQILGVTPASGASDVPTTSVFKIAFTRPFGSAAPGQLLLWTPSVEGTTRWDGRTLVFAPAAAFLPNTTYTVSLTVDPGGHWSFQTRLRTLYLAPDARGQDQLMLLSQSSARPMPVTHETYGVWDYAVAPDGSAVVYSATRADAGRDLWSIGLDGEHRRLIKSCPGATCSGAAWSSQGKLVYEQSGAGNAAARLWWLDLATGQTNPVVQDAQESGSGANWSPDGRHLAYVTGEAQRLRILDIGSGQSQLVDGPVGQPPAWSPRGDALLVSVVSVQSGTYVTHLLKVDITSRQVTDLSGDELTNDSSAVWSQDGAWIIFTRRMPTVPMGGQLWLMRANGVDAHALTNDPEVQHIAAAWSRDGTHVLYYQVAVDQSAAQPSIGLVDVATGSVEQIAPSGQNPTWIP